MTQGFIEIDNNFWLTNAGLNAVNARGIYWDPYEDHVAVKIASKSIKHSISNDVDSNPQHLPRGAQDNEAPKIRLRDNHKFDEIIRLTGKLTDERTLSGITSDADTSDTEINVVDGSLFSHNDIVRIRDNGNILQENTIDSVSGNTITLKNPLSQSIDSNKNAYIYIIGNWDDVSTFYKRALGPMQKKDQLLYLAGRQGIQIGENNGTTVKYNEIGVERGKPHKLRSGMIQFVTGHSDQAEVYNCIIKKIDFTHNPEPPQGENRHGDTSIGFQRDIEVKIELAVGELQ